MYRTFCIYLFLSLAALNMAFGNAQEAELIKIRLGQHEGEKTRIVLDISTPIQWSLQDQTEPDMLKLDMVVNTANANLPKNSKFVKEIRLSAPLVFRFSKPIAVQKAFSIPPSAENQNFRIVLDVQAGEQLKSSLTAPVVPSITPLQAAMPHAVDRIIEEILPAQKPPSQKVIIIDAGHGGEDPGTLGNHTREKDITFKMAKVLKKTLEVNPKYKVILTRDSDRFVRLGDRIRKARHEKGDLFISLHADSGSADAQGLSVYTLSHVASDRDAERLAAKENKADLIMGVELESESPEVANILIDLVKRETMNMSARLAGTLIKSLKKKVQLLKNTHRFAAFAVLRAPEIPSVLIELGFLSNAEDEKLLNSKAYRQKIADGILQGITLYFEQFGRTE